MRSLRAKIGLAVLTSTLAWVVAVPVSASASEFKAAAYPATLTGSQLAGERVQISFGTFGSVSCETATLSGSIAGASSEITLHPVFGTCKGLGSEKATITTTGCNFKYHSGKLAGTLIWEGTLDNACESGKAIVVSAGNCEAELLGFNGHPEVELIDDGGLIMDLATRYFFFSELPYTVTKDGFGCPFEGLASYVDGVISGRQTITATSVGKQVSFFV